MIKIKCNNCGKEFDFNKDKCPYCKDPVKTSYTFYCGTCENKMKLGEEICTNCNKKPEDIIIEKSDGEKIKTKFDTEEIKENNEDISKPKRKPRKLEKLTLYEVFTDFIVYYILAYTLIHIYENEMINSEITIFDILINGFLVFLFTQSSKIEKIEKRYNTRIIGSIIFIIYNLFCFNITHLSYPTTIIISIIYLIYSITLKYNLIKE